MATLQQLNKKDLSYNEKDKDAFHRAGKKALKALAVKLELPAGSYDIRSNKAGIAVSGEVTLHSEKLYIEIGQSFGSNGLKVLFRTCKGRRDFTGGQNNFADIDRFESSAFVEQLKKMSV